MNQNLLSTTKYDSEGTALTGSVFAKILVTLYNGKRFKRSEAIEQVTAYHIAHGGFIESEGFVGMFKTAAHKILKESIKNVAYGVWELHYNEKTKDTNYKNGCVSESGSEVGSFATVADETIGQGKQDVYIFYYDSHKMIADMNDKKMWPCKIGMSTVSAHQRISDMCQTAFPEKPHIALLIKDDDARTLEGILHSILSYNGRRVEGATGCEWFKTSPDEIKEIYDRIRLKTEM